MTTPVQHYSIVFNTDAGSRRTLRISNPNPALPLEDVQAAVDTMLANDVFEPNPRGALKDLCRMELTVVQRSTVL